MFIGYRPHTYCWSVFSLAGTSLDDKQGLYTGLFFCTYLKYGPAAGLLEEGSLATDHIITAGLFLSRWYIVI